MKLPRDVGRRHDDCKGFFIRIDMGGKIFFVHPFLIQPALYILRRIGFFQFLFHICLSPLIRVSQAEAAKIQKSPLRARARKGRKNAVPPYLQRRDSCVLSACNGASRADLPGNPFCPPVPKPRSVCAVPNRLSAGERFSLGAPAGVLFFVSTFFLIIRANRGFVKTGFLFFCCPCLIFLDSAVQNPIFCAK